MYTGRLIRGNGYPNYIEVLIYTTARYRCALIKQFSLEIVQKAYPDKEIVKAGFH